jgi:tetratricopeptide (TPR) repeat protein
VKKGNEESQLKMITDEFSRAIENFSRKEYQKAHEVFDEIVKKYDDSEYYSVQEVHARSKAYKIMADAQLNPPKIVLKNEEDYLGEGIFNLNAGELDKAVQHFKHLENKKYREPYLYYLLSIVHLKKGDKETALNYLKKSVKKDDHFKIIAYNEPDFESLLENEDFLSIVE